MTKIVELNIGANQYYGGCSGTDGTGTLDTFKVATPIWKEGMLDDAYQLIDGAGVAFPISHNTPDTLNVVGTPTSSDVDHPHKILPLPYLTGFIGGTSLILDASKIDVDWMNAVLTIQRPVSKSTQKTGYNENDAYTYNPETQSIIVNTDGNFDSALKAGDIIVLNGVEYPLMLPPVGNQAIINATPIPPTSGKLVCYKTQKEYGINLKKISHNVSVEGWLTNDTVHHPDWAVKLYAEEKAELLYRIVGANAGTIDFSNLVFRENSYLRGKYARFVTGDSGDGVGTLNTFTDDNKDWTDDEWIGYVLVDSNRIRYPITDNDDTTLTIAGTPEDGNYTISGDGSVNGCMACTKMKISDNTKVVAPVRGGGDGTDQHVDKLMVSLSFKYVDPK